MKENYTKKVDKLITKLKESDIYFLGVIVETIEKFKPISKSEIRTALAYTQIETTQEQNRFIYEQIGI